MFHKSENVAVVAHFTASMQVTLRRSEFIYINYFCVNIASVNTMQNCYIPLVKQSISQNNY